MSLSVFLQRTMRTERSAPDEKESNEARLKKMAFEMTERKIQA